MNTVKKMVQRHRQKKVRQSIERTKQYKARTNAERVRQRILKEELDARKELDDLIKKTKELKGKRKKPVDLRKAKSSLRTIGKMIKKADDWWMKD